MPKICNLYVCLPGAGAEGLYRLGRGWFAHWVCEIYYSRSLVDIVKYVGKSSEHYFKANIRFCGSWGMRVEHGGFVYRFHHIILSIRGVSSHTVYRNVLCMPSAMRTTHRTGQRHWHRHRIQIYNYLIHKLSIALNYKLHLKHIYGQDI